MSELATRVIEPIEELLERMNVRGVFGEPPQAGVTSCQESPSSVER